jgi:hypothetical protein
VLAAELHQNAAFHYARIAVRRCSWSRATRPQNRDFRNAGIFAMGIGEETGLNAAFPRRMPHLATRPQNRDCGNAGIFAMGVGEETGLNAAFSPKNAAPRNASTEP